MLWVHITTIRITINFRHKFTLQVINELEFYDETLSRLIVTCLSYRTASRGYIIVLTSSLRPQASGLQISDFVSIHKPQSTSWQRPTERRNSHIRMFGKYNIITYIRRDDTISSNHVISKNA